MNTAKKYNIIYRITNLLTDRVYIGRHCTNKINDSYMGSGKKLLDDIKKYGKDQFKKEILYVFDTTDEMICKEIELIRYLFKNNIDTYNISRQGTGLLTHTEAVRKKMRDLNTGFVSAIDSDGNCHRVSVNDPRYLSGELVHNSKGKIVAKDSDGNVHHIDVDDPRWISGELVGINAGRKKTKEQIENHRSKMIKYWETNKHSEHAKQKMRSSNIGKVTVRDSNGRMFRVSVDDERIKTGELVYSFVGIEISEDTRKKHSINKKGCIWISNTQMNQNKLIKPDIAQVLLNDGWVLGRINKTEETSFG